MSSYAEWADANPSEIYGEGWGSDHHWHYEGSSPGSSGYKCARCFWPFAHAYNHEPNIFKAMRADGVPDKCARQQLWPIRYQYASQEERDHFAALRAASQDEHQEQG